MWQIEYKGEKKTFEEWGVMNSSRRLLSLDIDVFQCEAARDIDEADLFERGQTIKVFNGEVQWFAGPIDQTPKTATGRYESHGYVAVGPWWYLANQVYQQTWKELANPLDSSAGFVTKYRSHLLLGYNVDGNFISTKDIVTDALNYVLGCAIDAGIAAPFQIGTIDLPVLYPPVREVLNRACSEVILQVLRWTPDAIGIVDYATSPPTLHIKQRSGLARVTLDLPDGGKGPKQLNIRPRYDLKLPAVVIKYEIVNIVDGLAYPQLIVDIAPALQPNGQPTTGREFGAIVDTISLEGGVISYAYSAIICEAIDTGSLDWWKANNHVIGTDRVKNLVIAPTSVLSNTAFPRQLVQGTIAPWMLRNGFDAARDVIQAKASYDLVDEPGTVLEHKNDVYIEVELVATNLTTGTYKTVESETLAEPVPVGLAGYLYAAASVLHYDGAFDLVEDECSGKVGIGSLVNITGARQEYEAMNAVVQSITEDIESGTTSVTVGPPKHLGKDDIIEFLSQNRNRVRLTASKVMSSGTSFGATPNALPKEAPVKNTNAANGQYDLFTVAKYVVIDKADNPNNLDIRLRTLPFCDDSTGVPIKRKITGLFSDVHD
jgi:hypothetical protein